MIHSPGWYLTFPFSENLLLVLTYGAEDLLSPIYQNCHLIPFIFYQGKSGKGNPFKLSPKFMPENGRLGISEHGYFAKFHFPPLCCPTQICTLLWKLKHVKLLEIEMMPNMFRLFLGPSEQNELYHTPILSKIWDLGDRKFFGGGSL